MCRTKVVAKLATQDLAYIQRVGTATLLTNLTADVDAVKLFVSQAVGSLVSSVFLIIGASALLLSINWKLGLAVLVVLPIIGITFKVVLGRVQRLFTKAMQAIDRLNKVINESILGAALIIPLTAGMDAMRQLLFPVEYSDPARRDGLMPVWIELAILVGLAGTFLVAAGRFLAVLERKAKQEGRLSIRWQ